MMATLSLKLGDLPAAKKYATENLELARKGTAKTSTINALLTLSHYYEAVGNNAKALALTHEAIKMKDSLISETNIRQINTLATIYETDKKQQDILRLENEKGIQTVAVKQKSVLNRIFVATIIGLLFFGWLAYRNVKNEKKITAQQRKIQAQRISELEKDKQLLTIDAILKGQEEERSRIAKDLHDGLGGMLSGLKLSFINMKEKIIFTQENLNNFERSVGLLDSTIGELRKVAHNLMPEVLVKFGLEEALKDFCGSIQATTGISIVYQQFGDERKLNNQADANIYRIIQELVHNAVKHADASQIIVQLTKNHINTGITVEDDGKGFDVKILDTKKGAGFNNIRYRVLYFKGTLDIMSEPGNGTSVSIELIV
jgi:signal transduction histidine kinase